MEKDLTQLYKEIIKNKDNENFDFEQFDYNLQENLYRMIKKILGNKKINYKNEFFSYEDILNETFINFFNICKKNNYAYFNRIKEKGDKILVSYTFKSIINEMNGVLNKYSKAYNIKTISLDKSRYDDENENNYNMIYNENEDENFITTINDEELNFKYNISKIIFNFFKNYSKNKIKIAFYYYKYLCIDSKSSKEIALLFNKKEGYINKCNKTTRNEIIKHFKKLGIYRDNLDSNSIAKYDDDFLDNMKTFIKKIEKDFIE